VRETHRAREDVLAAVNPDAPSSPMAILKASLTGMLREHATAQAELAKQQGERQAQFEKEVSEALTRIETKRTHDQKTPRGGFAFEDAVTAFVGTATQGAPCVFEVTGATAGIGRCKKGDAILRFTSESAFAGAAVVFEAKRDAAYTVQRAIDDLDAARKNRDAVTSPRCATSRRGSRVSSPASRRWRSTARPSARTSMGSARRSARGRRRSICC
jgi:hypothetical protein